MVSCFLCKLVFEDFRSLKLHFIQFHNLNYDSKVRCGETDCFRTFNSLHALNEHYKRVHITKQNVESQLNAPLLNQECNKSESKFEKTSSQKELHHLNSSHLQDNNCIASVRTDSKVESNSVSVVPSSKICISNGQFQKRFNVFVKQQSLAVNSQLFDLNFMTRVNIQEIVCMFQKFLDNNLNLIQFQLDNNRNKFADDDFYLMLSQMLASFKNSFQGLHTDYLRIKALKDSGLYIPPVKYVVGQKNLPAKSSDGHVTLKNKKIDAQFFPLRDTLKSALSLPNVLKKILDYKSQLECETEIISNFIQGDLWKEKIKNYSENDIVLPMFVFFDDFEPGNLVGSHSGIQKMGGVYVSIPCIPPEYRGSLDNLFCALMFHSKHRKEFGNDAVFQVLIEELEFLQTNGIIIPLPEGDCKVYFKLGLLVGDNLGLHSILGLIENFVGHFSCRICKMEKKDRDKSLVEDPQLLRTLESYKSDVKLNDPGKTGIKSECCFNKLSGFDITKNSAVDIMHDVFEGACTSDMVEILNYLMYEKGYFDIDFLNNRITYFDWGAYESNKVPLIDEKKLKKGTIRFSASEMWTFVIYFGLLVGDRVPENDPVWKFYLLLREIVSIITAPSFQKGTEKYLKSLIEEHNAFYITFFGKHLKHKPHLITHYPGIMLVCGPLVHLWCMRFESENQKMKHHTVTSFCKKNTPATISKRTQLKNSNKLRTQSFLKSCIKSGPPTLLEQSELRKVFTKYKSIELDKQFSVVPWVEYKNTTYKVNSVVCIGEEAGFVQFGLIKRIILDQKNQILFIIDILEAVWEPHFYAYSVFSKNERCCAIEIDELLHFKPLSIIKMYGRDWVVLKTSL